MFNTVSDMIFSPLCLVWSLSMFIKDLDSTLDLGSSLDLDSTLVNVSRWKFLGHFLKFWSEKCIVISKNKPEAKTKPTFNLKLSKFVIHLLRQSPQNAGKGGKILQNTSTVIYGQDSPYKIQTYFYFVNSS